MRFLLDHNVPASVGAVLRERGHDVIAVTDILPPDAKDPIVVAAAVKERRILISHDKDMKRAESLMSEGKLAKTPTLHRLQLSCSEVDSANRVFLFAALIETEFECISEGGGQFAIEIGARRLRVFR